MPGKDKQNIDPEVKKAVDDAIGKDSSEAK